MKDVNMAYIPPTGGGNPPNVDTNSGYFAIVAWIVAILTIIVAVRTRIGYYVIFMFVIASILVVLAVGSPTLIQIMQIGSQKIPGSGTPPTAVVAPGVPGPPPIPTTII